MRKPRKQKHPAVGSPAGTGTAAAPLIDSRRSLGNPSLWLDFGIAFGAHSIAWWMADSDLSTRWALGLMEALQELLMGSQVCDPLLSTLSSSPQKQVSTAICTRVLVWTATQLFSAVFLSFTYSSNASSNFCYHVSFIIIQFGVLFSTNAP